MVVSGGITPDSAKGLHFFKDALASNTRLEYVTWGIFDKNMTKDDIGVANNYMNDIEQTLKLNRRMQSHTASVQKKKLLDTNIDGDANVIDDKKISHVGNSSRDSTPTKLISQSSPTRNSRENINKIKIYETESNHKSNDDVNREIVYQVNNNSNDSSSVLVEPAACSTNN